MTFEEYEQALADNTGLMAERGQDLDKDKIYIGDKNEGQPLVVLNLTQNNIESIIGSVLKDYPPSDIAYLFDKTKEFLDTPHSRRGLEPVYELVFQILTTDRIVLGIEYFDNTDPNSDYRWHIGKRSELKSKGYQYQFTDKDLEELTGNGFDEFLTGRFQALKERI